jgi:hypothetical protein
MKRSTWPAVHDALLAREERVALGAQVGAQIFAGGSGLPGVATGAGDRRVDVLGMDTGFH